VCYICIKIEHRGGDTVVSLEMAMKLIEENIGIKEKIILLPIENATNYILSQDIYAPISVPNFNKSAMDGYAVKAEETKGASMERPVTFSVIGELCAGEYGDFFPKEMDAIRIMTGACVPEGYDSVVRQEDTNYGEESVQVYISVEKYMNYCKIGEDIQHGQLIIQKNTKLNSLHIGVLASLGISEVSVMEPLKVGIICTGTELLYANQKMEPGKIYDSIGYTLVSRINMCGHVVCFHEICSDHLEVLLDKIQNRIDEVDILITTGGVSVGKRDYMPEAMKKLHAKKLFQGIEIQPGTPTMLFLLKEKPILSLSGNPYAAITHFEFLYWRIVSRLLNNPTYNMKQESAILKSEYNNVVRNRRLIRAYVEGDQVWIPSIMHQSSVISNMIECNCFIDLSGPNQPELEERVNIWRIKI